MITYTTGNIFEANVEALVNTVNCVGIMGRGIALQSKKSFPKNFKAYELACKQGQLKPGQMFVFDTGQLTNPRYIINFPTKRHWRGKSHIKDIESGLKSLKQEIKDRGIKSIAIPPLGSGLGGLPWGEVRIEIVKSLSELEHVNVVVYEPNYTLEPRQTAKSREVPPMTLGRASLIGLMGQYLAGLLDPVVTLLEVYKLMYFMQEAGQPLKLNYVKWQYGPYPENLRHVLNQLEGHYISGFGDGGESPTKELSLIPGALAEATQIVLQDPTTNEHFKRVTDLVSGFESPFGMELLASVHWIASKEQPSSLEDLLSGIHNWNKHKHKFSSRQIELAYLTLSRKGWLDGTLHSPHC